MRVALRSRNETHNLSAPPETPPTTPALVRLKLTRLAANLHCTDRPASELEQITVTGGGKLENYFCKFQARCLARVNVEIVLDGCPRVFEHCAQCPQRIGVVHLCVGKGCRDVHDKPRRRLSKVSRVVDEPSMAARERPQIFQELERNNRNLLVCRTLEIFVPPRGFASGVARED